MSESADHLGVGPRPWLSQSHHGGNSGCEGQRRWRLKDSTPEIRKRKSRQEGRSTVFSGNIREYGIRIWKAQGVSPQEPEERG